MTSSSISSRRRGRLEAEHLARLLDRRDAPLDVVLERVVVNERNGSSGPLILRQISSASSSTVVDVGRREVEVLVERRRVLHRRRRCRARGRRRRCSGGPGCPSPRMCSGSWPLSDLLDEVGDDVAHRELHVAAT